MTHRTVGSWLQQWTCVAGTCAPPSATATTRWERAADAYTGFTAVVLRGCWAIPLAVAIFFFSRAVGSVGLYITAVYFLAYATYCLANFARCREAHCIVTGFGWVYLVVWR